MDAPVVHEKLSKGQPGARRSYKGYIQIHIGGRGTMGEHVLVMEAHLGRQLRAGELVHHRNGVRHDNRIKNLELWTKSHPSGQRVADKVQWAKELLALYEPEALND